MSCPFHLWLYSHLPMSDYPSNHRRARGVGRGRPQRRPCPDNFPWGPQSSTSLCPPSLPPSLPLPFARSSVRVRPSEDPFPPFLSDFPFRARCLIVAAVIVHSLRQSVQDSKRVNFRPTDSHPARPADGPPFPALLPVTRPLDHPFEIFLYLFRKCMTLQYSFLILQFELSGRQ